MSNCSFNEDPEFRILSEKEIQNWFSVAYWVFGENKGLEKRMCRVEAGR